MFVITINIISSCSLQLSTYLDVGQISIKLFSSFYTKWYKRLYVLQDSDEVTKCVPIKIGVLGKFLHDFRRPMVSLFLFLIILFLETKLTCTRTKQWVYYDMRYRNKFYVLAKTHNLLFYLVAFYPLETVQQNSCLLLLYNNYWIICAKIVSTRRFVIN